MKRQSIMSLTALSLSIVALAGTIAYNNISFANGKQDPLANDVLITAVPTNVYVVSDAENVCISQGNPEPVIQNEPANKPQAYYYNIEMPEELQELVWQACEETGCPYELALGVIWMETRYQNINGDGGNSIGYMQIQPRWHKDRMERLGVTDLSDPLSNFRVGCDLLAELTEKYTVEEALTCYNSGKPGKSKYADKVIQYMDML